jgi:uncharacterized membrane protein
MSTGRLEAFTDGVIAIIITIMVLEMKTPQGSDFASLRASLPVFFAYALSYINVGVFWNNHHHMLHAAKHVNGWVLWANLLLLFPLSLVPLVIRWMDETHFAALPTAAYGVTLAGASIAYLILQRAIVKADGPNSTLANAIGNDTKGKASLVFYVLAIPLAFARPWIAIALYVAVALVWFVPDRRIEAMLSE